MPHKRALAQSENFLLILKFSVILLIRIPLVFVFVLILPEGIFRTINFARQFCSNHETAPFIETLRQPTCITFVHEFSFYLEFNKRFIVARELSKPIYSEG